MAVRLLTDTTSTVGAVRPDLGATYSNIVWDPASTARERMALLSLLTTVFQGTAEYLPTIVRTYNYDRPSDSWSRAYHARGLDAAPVKIQVEPSDNCLTIMARLRKRGYSYQDVMRGIGYSTGDLASEVSTTNRQAKGPQRLAAKVETAVAVKALRPTQAPAIPIVELETED